MDPHRQNMRATRLVVFALVWGTCAGIAASSMGQSRHRRLPKPDSIGNPAMAPYSFHPTRWHRWPGSGQVKGLKPGSILGMPAVRTPDVLSEETSGVPNPLEDETDKSATSEGGPPTPGLSAPLQVPVLPSPSPSSEGEGIFDPFKPEETQSPAAIPRPAPLFQPKGGVAPQQRFPSQPTPQAPPGQHLHDPFSNIKFQKATSPNRTFKEVNLRKNSDRARELALRHLVTRSMVARRNDSWYQMTSMTLDSASALAAEQLPDAEEASQAEPSTLQEKWAVSSDWQPTGLSTRAAHEVNRLHQHSNPLRGKAHESGSAEDVQGPIIIPTAAWERVKFPIRSTKRQTSRHPNPLR